MTSRRRNVYRKLKERYQPAEKQDTPVAAPEPVSEGKGGCQEFRTEEKQKEKEGYLPLAVALEILAGEFEEGEQGKALCRAAVRLAEESGLITKYRARWDAEENGPSGSHSVFLFDRRQSLELIRYHQSKGNEEAVRKEKDKLKIIEGRLLLGQSSPLRVTNEDLEKLENFIKESGF